MCDCKSQSFFVKYNWNLQKHIHLTSTKDTPSRRAHRTKARLEMTNWSKDKEQPVHWNYTETGAPTPVTRNVSPPTALDTSTECARDAAPGEKWTGLLLFSFCIFRTPLTSAISNSPPIRDASVPLEYQEIRLQFPFLHRKQWTSFIYACSSLPKYDLTREPGRDVPSNVTKGDHTTERRRIPPAIERASSMSQSKFWLVRSLVQCSQRIRRRY